MKDQTKPQSPPAVRPSANKDPFPLFVYKSPGPHNAGTEAPGETYGYRSAQTQQELEQLLAKGYSKSIAEAVEAAKAKKATGK